MKNQSIKIVFTDNNESIFNDINVKIPKMYQKNDDYKDVLNNVINDDDILANDAAAGIDADNMDIINDILYNELQERYKDINQLIDGIFGKDNGVDGGYIDVIKERHNEYKLDDKIKKQKKQQKSKKKKLKSQKSIAKQKMNVDGNDDDISIEQLLLRGYNVFSDIKESNSLWVDLLLGVPRDLVSILSNELNDRTDDIQNVQDVVINKDVSLYNCMDDIIEYITKRHNDCFVSWNDNIKLINKWNNVIDIVNISNSNWRKQLQMPIYNDNISDNNDNDEKKANDDNNDIVIDDNNENDDKDNVNDNLDLIPNGLTIDLSLNKKDDDDNMDNSFLNYDNLDDDVNYNSAPDFYHNPDDIDMDLNNPNSDLNDHSWLYKDDIRNSFLDSLKVNQHTMHLLTYIGQYLNRIVPTSDDLQPIKLQQLYIPIKCDDARNVIMTCLDGVLFATLINLVEPDFIDMRALDLPKYNSKNSNNIQPLTELEISENMTTVFASIRALDLQIPHWTIHDYLETNNTVNIILSIVFQLFHGMLSSQINIKTYPELVRLCRNDDERHNAPDWEWSKWLNRWLLHIKDPKKAPLTPISQKSFEYIQDNMDKKMQNIPQNIPSFPSTDNNSIIQTDGDLVRHILHTTDYNDYLILLCCRMDTNFLSNILPKIQSNKNNKNKNNDISAQLILKCIKNSIGVNTIIKIEDISSRNPMLQEVLLADIFEKNNQLKKIDNLEKKRLTSIIHITTKEERSLIAWINALLDDARYHITNIESSLTDGIIILKLLDKMKYGVVNWDKVRQKNEIRHKFDKLTNCKFIMDICKNNFVFSLVGMGGNDIAEGKIKYIQTLLWQIMRYDSTRALSELQFNGKQVTDKMILKWGNNRVQNYKQLVNDNNNDINVPLNKIKSVNIKSFRDPSLNDSIFFLNLLSSIHHGWVNYDLVYCIPFNNNDQDNNKKRLANSRYCLTIIRKLGGELFVLPNDICKNEPKSLLSVMANIMTLAAKHSDDDESKLLNHQPTNNNDANK